MRKMGLLSGISYVSGLDYIRGVSEKVAALVPRGPVMPKNSLIAATFVDCDQYVALLEEEDFPAVARYLVDEGAAPLARAGADFAVIASNTGHIAAELIAAELPGLPLLHIADCTAAEARRVGARTVGLLGTRPTMAHDYLKRRLRAHGLSVLVPEEDADRRRCYDIICQELSFERFLPESRAFFVSLVRGLATRGAGAVVLGCTEIELLVKQADVPEVPLLLSAALHIDAAARVQAGERSLADFLPPSAPPPL